jgi:hypothetical protein
LARSPTKLKLQTAIQQTTHLRRTAEKLAGPLMDALARQGWQTEKIVVEAHRRRAVW